MEAPARDGRVFTETPASVAEVFRIFLAAEAAWGDGLRRDDLTLAERTRLYEAAFQARRELIRAMEEAQGRWARLSGYYEVGGAWVGFDKVDACGLTLVVKRTRPVFAKKGARP
jgi:hypothetical protein